MAVAEWELQQELLITEEESQIRAVWRRFRRHKLAVLGLGVISVVTFLSITAPWIAPYDPLRINMAEASLGPQLGWGNGKHLLGTDRLGRDLLTRLLYAGRVSLTVGFIATLGSEFLGTIIGAISGYLGGWVDSFIMRVVDFMLTLPLLPLLMVASILVPKEVFPGGSVGVLIFLLIIFGWTGSSRLVRGVILALREEEFTEAARALGVSTPRIILRHMIPNALAPILVSATLAVGGYIVLEAILSFLGLGVQPPYPSWGNMLFDVQAEMWVAPQNVFYPGMAIFLVSLSFNFVGDALRDALDPRLKI